MFSFLSRSRKSPSVSRKSTAPRFRPMFEALEDRRLLAASAFSNLGGVPVQFNLLGNGHLRETVGGAQTDLGTVQGLYQGKDFAGRQVAFDWVSGTLSEFAPGLGFVTVGGADQVAQDNRDEVFFRQGSLLRLATGVPAGGVAGSVPVLGGVQDLATVGGQASARIGPYFKANVTAQVQPASGAATLGLTNVQMNVGQFAGSFLSRAVTDLQSFTRPLQPLADALTNPLLPGWGFTATWLMQQLGYGPAASAAKTFADTIHTINSLPTSLSSNDGWVNLGSFSASVQGPAQLTTLSSAANTAAGIASRLGNSVSAALGRLRSIPGLQIVLDNPKELMKLLTGEKATLFSYTFSAPGAISVSKEQQLAAIPVSPVTLTEIDLFADLGVSVGGQATFGFDTSGLASGNLMNGFFIQNANVTASLTAGLSGLVNEANLAGYKLTGAVTGTVTASLRGADGSGKVYANQIQSGAIAVSAPNWHFGITSQFLGPQQMLTLAVQQYGPYLKSLLGYDAQIAANILNGKGVSLDDIAAAIGTYYGLSPNTTAGILGAMSHDTTVISHALKHAFSGLSLNGMANALYHGISWTGYRDVAAGLGSLTHDTGLIAAALRNQLNASYNTIADALYHGISWTNYRDVANGLGNVTSDAAVIAGALRSQLNASLNTIADALYHGVGWATYREVAGGLASLTHDVTAIAGALRGQLSASYNMIADALYHGISWTGYQDVARGLGSLTHDVTAIAGALRNELNASFNAIADALYHGISWTGYQDVAQGLGSLTRDVGVIAGALRNQLGASYNAIADALYNGIDWTGYQDVAKGLGSLTHDVGTIATALRDQLHASYNTIANALYNGISWTSYQDVATGLKAITTDAGTIANALRNGAGAAESVVSGVLQNIGSGLSNLGSVLGSIASGNWPW
jgi:hypothetical protein